MEPSARYVHDEIVDRLLSKYGGRRVNHTGDGVFALFDVPSKAARCALELVPTLAGHGLRIRTGIHVGECERRGDEWSGPGGAHRRAGMRDGRRRGNSVHTHAARSCRRIRADLRMPWPTTTQGTAGSRGRLPGHRGLTRRADGRSGCASRDPSGIQVEGELPDDTRQVAVDHADRYSSAGRSGAACRRPTPAHLVAKPLRQKAARDQQVEIVEPCAVGMAGSFAPRTRPAAIGQRYSRTVSSMCTLASDSSQ